MVGCRNYFVSKRSLFNVPILAIWLFFFYIAVYGIGLCVYNMNETLCVYTKIDPAANSAEYV